MSASTYLNQVQQLYIAYFGRPADLIGQHYWAQVIDNAGGDISAVISGFSASSESVALYGNSSTTQQISAIYQNVFGRAPEPAGLAYWVALVDSGKVSQAQAAWNIQQAAGPGDASVVNNKLIAANAFTANLDTTTEIAGYTGATAAAAARAYLNKVDATYQSIADVATTSAAAVAEATGTGTVVPPPVVPVAPVPLFSASVTAGVVSFSGAATGDITVTWSGPAGASAATFSRDGNAATAITFGGVGATSVKLAATETLVGSASTLASFTTTGAGTVKLTDTASELDGKTFAANTAGIDVLNVTTQATAATSLAGLSGFSNVHLAGSTDTVTLADGTVSVDSSASATVQLGTGNQTFIGLGGDYTITAGVGSNIIAAGTGTHTLKGNLGNDTFIVAAGSTNTIIGLGANDVLNNTAGGTVTGDNTHNFNATAATINNGAVTLNALASGTTINLQLAGGTAGFTVNGGAAGDIIYGSANNDVLSGGLGTNILTGGLGNDTFNVLATANDTLQDLSTGDILTVAAGGTATATAVSSFIATAATVNAGTVTLKAAATASVIDLALATGAAGFTVTGDAGNDTITGSAKADIISGGAGDDTLTGGLGDDTFVISGVTSATNGQDSITDFTAGADKIQFSLADVNPAAGAALVAGALDASNFISGPAATSATEYFIYDAATGVLSFDADGNGVGAAVALVTLTGNPVIAASDIVLA